MGGLLKKLEHNDDKSVIAMIARLLKATDLIDQ